MTECKHGPVEGTLPLERAAALIGMDVKRLAGRIWRDKVGDPVGCKVCGYVYLDSLPSPTDDMGPWWKGERNRVVREARAALRATGRESDSHG